MQDSFATKPNLYENKKVVKSASELNLLLGTPRILELDINRMMISQNQISYDI